MRHAMLVALAAATVVNAQDGDLPLTTSTEAAGLLADLPLVTTPAAGTGDNLMMAAAAVTTVSLPAFVQRGWEVRQDLVFCSQGSDLTL